MLKILVHLHLSYYIILYLALLKTKFYDENDTGVILQFIQTDVNEAGAIFAEIVTEMFFMGLIRFSIVAIFYPEILYISFNLFIISNLISFKSLLYYIFSYIY